MLLINERAAARLWPGEDPLGKQLIFGSGPREVVGVIEDHRAGGPSDDVFDLVYLPLAQAPSRGMAVLVRVGGDPAALVPAVRDQVLALDPAQPIYAVRTLEQVVTKDVRNPKVMMQVMLALAVLALVLAVVGVYGVVSYCHSAGRMTGGHMQRSGEVWHLPYTGRSGTTEV